MTSRYRKIFTDGRYSTGEGSDDDGEGREETEEKNGLESMYVCMYLVYLMFTFTPLLLFIPTSSPPA